MSARVAVVIPCYNDAALVTEAVASVDEPEPVEVVVVDDASTDPATRATIDRLEAQGVHVVRHERNRGLAEARMTGVAATNAPYVFPLDSDDLCVPGTLAAMADKLDAAPDAAVCLGDYEEFGDHRSIVAVPDTLDLYRLAWTYEYGPALFRRTTLVAVDGWRHPGHTHAAYEDWQLIMSLAERGEHAVRIPHGVSIYRRRLHGERALAVARRKHRALYRDLRRAHPGLYRDMRSHWRACDLPPLRKALYPVIYGPRPRFHRLERVVRFWLDRHGVWTLRRRIESPGS
ncbi:MAG: glycosyltransferase [Actinomycetota bacterium]|nr:glycosyltransferase [Actinomycetota bacterium]